MSDLKDFVIEDGVLKKYVGEGGDVIIPEGVTTVGERTFYYCESLASVAMPDTITNIGEKAFCGCESLTDIAIPNSVISIGIEAFEYSGIQSITIPNSVTNIGREAFAFCDNLTDITLSDNAISDDYCLLTCHKLSNITFYGTNWPFAPQKGVYINKNLAIFENLMFFAPNLSFEEIKEKDFKIAAVKAFITRFSEYHNMDIVNDYVKYIASRKKALLPLLLQNDCVEIIQKLVEMKKITAKDVVDDYYTPAQNCNAQKCCQFLENTFNISTAASEEINNSLWNGVNFSLNGQKLLKCPIEKGEEYHIPEGTTEICQGAFHKTSLRTIYVPDTVKNIRAGAFLLGEEEVKTIYLPDVPIKVAAYAILHWDDTSTVFLFTYDATVATTFAHKFGTHPIYLGNIENIAVHAKKYLVENFLSAALNGQIDSAQPWYNSYLDYIKRNNKTFAEKAIKDITLLQWLINNSILTNASCENLLTKLNQAEQKSMVLEYQNKTFGNNPQKTNLSLDAIDGEIKKLEQAKERREKIAKQIGIEGVVFVASGYLEEFGEYNEYTEVIDRSDLKKFIEKRGGFLRGSVSQNTDYLICNDTTYESTKVKKAKELNVPIITEEEFLDLANPKQ